MKRYVGVLGMLLAVGSARADLVVTGTEVVKDRTGASQGERERKVYISPRGIRVDSEGESHILDARNGLMIEVDHRKKTARVITFKQLGEMTEIARKEADEAVARAQKELSSMPPNVRAQVEDAIRLQRRAQAARQKGAYKRTATGKKRTVNGFACEEVKETLNDEWVGTSCVHRGVKLSEGDRHMLQKLAKDMADAGVSGDDGGFTRAFLDGIPVEMAVVDQRSGQLKVEERVTRVESVPVSEALFDVPQGYTTQTWDGAGPHLGKHKDKH
ncbi:MAG: DUF4412 domain-containing protein [Myxococcota bacterium]